MIEDFEGMLAQAFMRWDINENGRIDRFEFQGLIEELAPDRAANASDAYDEMDHDDDKRITFDELLRWWQQNVL